MGNCSGNKATLGFSCSAENTLRLFPSSFAHCAPGQFPVFHLSGSEVAAISINELNSHRDLYRPWSQQKVTLLPAAAHVALDKSLTFSKTPFCS